MATTMTTGADGVAISEPIRKGRYIVKEHGATAGYLFEEVTLECTVKSDEITDLSATNRPVGVKLKLFKRDKDEYTGKTSDMPRHPWRRGADRRCVPGAGGRSHYRTGRATSCLKKALLSWRA